MKRYLSAAMALCVGLTMVPPAALAVDVQNAAPEVYGSVEDIFGPDYPKPKPNPDESVENVEVPDENKLQTNEDFKRYDPFYPQRSEYGDYTFEVPKLKGRLTFKKSNNKLVGTLFAPGTSESGGWKDATKRWTNDTGLCFAASCSNLIAWYLEQYKQLNPEDTTEHVLSEEAIFDRFRNAWMDEGGDQSEALSWYFAGGFPRGGNTPNNGHLNGTDWGGYLRNKIPNNRSDRWSDVSYKWKPQEEPTAYGSAEDNDFPFIEEVRGRTGSGGLSTHEKFSRQILRQLHYGVCSISLAKDSGRSGHAITLWGVDYDVKTGLVSAIYVTDSDDKTRGLFKVGIKKGNNDNDGIRLESYPYHPPIGGDSSPFITIRDSLVIYSPEVVKSNGRYTGRDAEITGIDVDADGRGITVRARHIPGEMLEYGYSYDASADSVTNWTTDNHFGGIDPDVYYFFARVKASNTHPTAGVSKARAQRIKTPSPASQDMVPSLSLGTEVFQQHSGDKQYIWYGVQQGTYDVEEDPILWRVLDTQGGANKLFVLSDRLFGSGADGSVKFSQGSNGYQGSDAQSWCKSFEATAIGLKEWYAIAETTKTDAAYTDAASGGVSFGAATDILSKDRVFLPSAEEITNAKYGLGTDVDRQGRYRAGSFDYWLRSPAAGGVGYVNAEGQVAQKEAQHAQAVRPAFNLDGNQVLYTAAVGNGQFTNFTGLEEIREVQSGDFRIVLKDDNRSFRVTTNMVDGQAGGLVVLPYEGAVSSYQNNEYISAIIEDENGKPAYYGKLALVDEASGNVIFKLPVELSNGSYTMRVFNEQYNGEKKTGVASAFYPVTLNVNGRAELQTVAEVDVSVAAPVKGQRPRAAESAGKNYTVAQTIWTPEHDVFRPNTKYDVKVSVKAAPEYTFAADTTFRLNGTMIKPAVHGEEYVMTYTDFSRTQEEDAAKPDNGGGSGGGSIGGGGIGGGEETEKPGVSENSDGSKTETVVKADGTKVETTTWPNGDKVVTETKKDGSVTTNIQKADGTTAKAVTDEKGRTEAEVQVSEKAENAAAQAGKPVELPIPAVQSGTNTENAPVIHVNTASGEKTKVMIPVSAPTFNTVAVVVNKDGSEEIVRKSVQTESGVALSVENGAVIKIVENTKSFVDTSGHWAKNSIDFVTSRELYAGTSETTFSPNNGMTRGMLAVVLHNMENNPESDAHTSFADVKNDAWYADGVRWADEKGIVTGYGNGQFGPNEQINREQLAVMLYRYMGSPAPHDSAVRNFKDASMVSPYAQDAMQWAVENGIISGTENNTLNPKGVATRAQVSAMLMRLLNNIG